MCVSFSPLAVINRYTAFRSWSVDIPGSMMAHSLESGSNTAYVLMPKRENSKRAIFMGIFLSLYDFVRKPYADRRY